MACSDCIPKRYIVVALLALGMCIVHIMRVNVAMTAVAIFENRVPKDEKSGVTVAPPDFQNTTVTVVTKRKAPTVAWDPFRIGVLHAVFYIGYLITQIPAGYLATIFPATRLFGGCILISCSLNLLVPVAIDRVAYWFTLVVRFLQGMSEGFLFPSCYAVMRHWTIPSERGSCGAAILTGIYLGPFLGLVTSGFIAHFIGWPFMFYIDGGLGIFWFIFWLFLIYQVPANHPYISPDELKYIQKHQDESVIMYENDRVPWKDIFLSLPVWALNVCNFARNFVFLLLLTNQPAYLNVFRFSLRDNGVYSALPHLLMTLVTAASGPLADRLMKDPMLTATHVRRMLTCLGFGAEATCIFLLFFISDGATALVFLTIGVGVSGLTVAGWQINHLDLAPRYASVLVGISMTFGTMAGIVSPIMAGHMTQNQTVYEWGNVWLVTSIILAFAVLVFALFGSGEKQPWAEPKPSEVRLVHSKDPFADPCYKTIHSQTGATHSDTPDLDIDHEKKKSEPGVKQGPPSEHKKPPLEKTDSTNPFEESDEGDSDNVDYGDDNPFSESSKKK